MFICEKCNKSFKSETGYKKHLETVHSETMNENILHNEEISFIDIEKELEEVSSNQEDKPTNLFSCPKCGSVFEPNVLGAHMRICQRRI